MNLLERLVTFPTSLLGKHERKDTVLHRTSHFGKGEQATKWACKSCNTYFQCYAYMYVYDTATT